MNAMIVGKVIPGVGGNGMYLRVITLLSVNTSEQERPMYLGMVGLAFGTGTCIGPIIGGGFAQSAVHWRFAFYLNLIIGGILAPVYIFLLPPFDPRPGMPYNRRVRESDYLGCFLAIGMVVFTIIPINFSGAIYAWNSATVVVLFVLGALFTLLFFLQQHTSFLTQPDYRMFPMQFFKENEYFLLFCLTAASNAAGFVTIYYIPLFFQFAKGDSPPGSAVKLLPLICMTSFTILLNDGMMGKFSVAQLIGIGLGLSISGAVFVNEAIAALTAALPGAARSDNLAAILGASDGFLNGLAPELQEAAIEGLVQTIQKVFYCVSAAGAFGLLLSLFLKRQKVSPPKA